MSLFESIRTSGDMQGGTRFSAHGPRKISVIARRFGIPREVEETVRLLSMVLPFRVNDYVLSQLIDWKNLDVDPMFQLVFPQRGMLSESDEKTLAEISGTGDRKRIAEVVRDIRTRLNPHPAQQQDLNVPQDSLGPIPGVQHKYRETLLYFPSSGQTCHAYCTYCFRWAQFVGDQELRFAAAEPSRAVAYLRRHPDITDVLVTGGDPMVMSSARLRQHLEPFLDVESVRTIRIGTKSVAYWPQRFVTDDDADEALAFFERVVAGGRTLAVMAHFSHEVEIRPDIARRALSRIRDTGAVIYCQAPLMAHVNDDAAAWEKLWRAELAAGTVPYYLLMSRDTGPHEYFRVPVDRAVRIYQDAYRRLPGLARTVRGPVMSTTAGKVVVDGVEEAHDGRAFRLRLLQARDPALVGRPFRARHSATAAWLDELRLTDDTPPDLARALLPDTATHSQRSL
ncbi:lysine 2,3-aminomutase [Streptomyces sp. NPDC001455]|uniref:KamA family radical SAM protein n=1 Tax=unclassified Streptomyces TaxID=2593676 RepID=UPI003333B0DB